MCFYSGSVPEGTLIHEICFACMTLCSRRTGLYHAVLARWDPSGEHRQGWAMQSCPLASGPRCCPCLGCGSRWSRASWRRLGSGPRTSCRPSLPSSMTWATPRAYPVCASEASEVREHLEEGPCCFKGWLRAAKGAQAGDSCLGPRAPEAGHRGGPGEAAASMTGVLQQTKGKKKTECPRDASSH